MGGKGRMPPPPKPIDPGQSMGEYLFGKGFRSQYEGVTDPRLQQRLLGAEREFRPQYSALELQDIGTFARGLEERDIANPRFQETEDRIKNLEAALAKTPETKREQTGGGVRGRKTFEQVPNEDYERIQAQLSQAKEDLRTTPKTVTQQGQSGLFDLLEESGKRAIGLQQLGRQADVESLQKFAPQVVEAYRAADPASTALAEQTTRRAMGQLTPEEEMNINQQARQASLARGRIGDESSVAGELMQREQFKSQFTPQAFQMNRALAGDLGATILGRPSQSLGLGSSVLGQATGLAGQPVGPQLFDPNMGLNMAMQQRSQDMTLLGAQAQAKATRSAGMAGMAGSIGGALIGL